MVIIRKRGRFRETSAWQTGRLSGRFGDCRVDPTLHTSLWIASRNSNRALPTFVIRGLIRQHLASNIGVAKSQIREKKPIVWEILQEVMQGHPVLLNRAPTLHRLGIQSFQPILVEGRTICLHPLTLMGINGCSCAFIFRSSSKARLLMFSHMNLLSPAIGDPISLVIFLFIEKSRKLY
ncbi:hypothetical protein HID58_096094, partial [Brassica napus]